MRGRRSTPTPTVAGSPRAVNAPRLSPGDVKWFDKGSDAFSQEYLEYSRDIGVCYDLVRLASHVLKRNYLRLKVGSEKDGIVHAATDGKTIFLPKLHPQRRIAVKHEISHLYFKSNIPLRLIFVQDMIARIEKESNKTFDPLTKNKLVDDLCFVINIFDDIRVNSLWGLIYPGDGQDMTEWYHGDVGPRMAERAKEDFPDGDIPHLFTYIILLTLGQEAKSKEWGEFENDIKYAGGQVHYKTFNAALLLVRDLILKIVRKVQEKEKPPDQPKANPTDRQDDDPELQAAEDSTGGGDSSPDEDIDDLVKARSPDTKSDVSSAVQILSRVESANRPSSDFQDDNAGFDFKQAPSLSGKDLEKDLKDVLAQMDQDLDDVLPDLEQSALDQVDEIQKAIAEKSSVPAGQSGMTDGEWLRKSVKAKVNLHEIKQSEVVPVTLTPEEMDTALRWKKFFQRVLGALSHRTEESGYELIADLYVQQKLGREPLSCFKVDTTGRGFRINLCVDMSGSMYLRFHEVQKLAKVLQIALSFPFVKLGVWGFNSKAAGEVDIYKFPSNAAGLSSARSRVDGVTPLSQAIQVVGRDLVGHRDDNHMFVLSDGVPVYAITAGRTMATKALINWTHDAVVELRQQKVKTYCFMIGQDTPNTTQMDHMFGVGYWKKIRDDQIYGDAFGLITTKFLQFLRAR